VKSDTHTRTERAPLPVYAAASIVIFFLALSAADSVGLVPEYLDDSGPVAPAVSNESQLSGEAGATKTMLPERIIIPDIGLDLPVQNPDTRDIHALDEFLKAGPARYVDSARLGEPGNILIFAHSSRLPVVRNTMYKAFNDVHKLEKGDTITLTARGKSYVYAVESVRQVSATNTEIDMSRGSGSRLTLVTCDTLTSKDARFVLEARLVGTFKI